MKKLLVSSLLVFSLVISSFSTAFGYNTRVPLPGSTIANKKLQKDTLMSVYLAVGTIMISSCKKMSVTDTKVTKEPYNLEYKDGNRVAGRWEELWTINACKQEFDVPIEFIMNKTGTSYIVYPKNVISK